MIQGKVYLVGAGPGDPGLMTVKGLKYLQSADVIIYDALVCEQILTETRPDVELIYVGKTCNHHMMEQDQINALLVQKAQENKGVVRLKGGDPFVFGRGGEEIEALAAHGIPFEVVPGISAGVAVPAYAGIPVTHRKFASSFALVTGHEDPTKSRSNIAWDKVATGVDTLVFFMGLHNLRQIVDELIKQGKSPTTPVALIQEGTRPSQNTLTGTLENIVSLAEERAIKPPAIIVVGEVVRLRDTARWFDNRPLAGKRVLVIRHKPEDSILQDILAEYGADPVDMLVPNIADRVKQIPFSKTVPMIDAASIMRGNKRLSEGEIDIVTFASSAAVCGLLPLLDNEGDALASVTTACIDPATAETAREKGLRVDIVAEDNTALGLAKALLEAYERRL